MYVCMYIYVYIYIYIYQPTHSRSVKQTDTKCTHLLLEPDASKAKRSLKCVVRKRTLTPSSHRLHAQTCASSQRQAVPKALRRRRREGMSAPRLWRRTHSPSGRVFAESWG